MDKAEAAEDIKLIREVMETSARYTNFSGISGIIAGTLALLGCGATYWVTLALPGVLLIRSYVIIWVLVLAISIFQDFALAQRKARRRGEDYFTPATAQVYKAVLPGIFVAVVLSIRALTLRELDAIPALWCLGYGAAICAAGRFSVREARIFGAVQLISGAIGLFLFATPPESLYFLAVTFGVYHILFGLILTRKYGW